MQEDKPQWGQLLQEIDKSVLQRNTLQQYIRDSEPNSSSQLHHDSSLS
jgi:hypothetical protein